MKWFIGAVVVLLVVWFIVLPWIRKYRANKASKQ